MVDLKRGRRMNRPMTGSSHAVPHGAVGMPVSQEHPLLPGVSTDHGSGASGVGTGGEVNNGDHAPPVSAVQHPLDPAHTQGPLYPGIHPGGVVAGPGIMAGQVHHYGPSLGNNATAGESTSGPIGGEMSDPSGKANAGAEGGIPHSGHPVSSVQIPGGNPSTMRGIDASQLAMGAVGVTMDPGDHNLGGGDGGGRRGQKRPWPSTPNCEQLNCFKSPSYGANGTPPLRCASHKMDGDVYVKNQCIHLGCSKVCGCFSSCCTVLCCIGLRHE